MCCFKIDMPEEVCKIDNELKAMYRRSNTGCIWVFKRRDDRNMLWMKPWELWNYCHSDVWV